MTLNEILWWAPNHLGWWFWVPLIPAGATALYYLYKLAPADTGTGRLIRVMLTLGCLCLVFIPEFNGLGTYAIHLLTYSIVLIVRQQYKACVRQGKITEPEAQTATGRLVERMVAR